MEASSWPTKHRAGPQGQQYWPVRPATWQVGQTNGPQNGHTGHLHHAGTVAPPRGPPGYQTAPVLPEEPRANFSPAVSGFDPRADHTVTRPSRAGQEGAMPSRVSQGRATPSSVSHGGPTPSRISQGGPTPWGDHNQKVATWRSISLDGTTAAAREGTRPPLNHVTPNVKYAEISATPSVSNLVDSGCGSMEFEKPGIGEAGTGAMSAQENGGFCQVRGRQSQHQPGQRRYHLEPESYHRSSCNSNKVLDNSPGNNNYHQVSDVYPGNKVREISQRQGRDSGTDSGITDTRDVRDTRDISDTRDIRDINSVDGTRPGQYATVNGKARIGETNTHVTVRGDDVSDTSPMTSQPWYETPTDSPPRVNPPRQSRYRRRHEQDAGETGSHRPDVNVAGGQGQGDAQRWNSAKSPSVQRRLILEKETQIAEPGEEQTRSRTPKLKSRSPRNSGSDSVSPRGAGGGGSNSVSPGRIEGGVSNSVNPMGVGGGVGNSMSPGRFSGGLSASHTGLGTLSTSPRQVTFMRSSSSNPGLNSEARTPPPPPPRYSHTTLTSPLYQARPASPGLQSEASPQTEQSHSTSRLQTSAGDMPHGHTNHSQAHTNLPPQYSQTRLTSSSSNQARPVSPRVASAASPRSSASGGYSRLQAEDRPQSDVPRPGEDWSARHYSVSPPRREEPSSASPLSRQPRSPRSRSEERTRARPRTTHGDLRPTWQPPTSPGIQRRDNFGAEERRDDSGARQQDKTMLNGGHDSRHRSPGDADIPDGRGGSSVTDARSSQISLPHKSPRANRRNNPVISPRTSRELNNSGGNRSVITLLRQGREVSPSGSPWLSKSGSAGRLNLGGSLTKSANFQTNTLEDLVDEMTIRKQDIIPDNRSRETVMGSWQLGAKSPGAVRRNLGSSQPSIPGLLSDPLALNNHVTSLNNHVTSLSNSVTLREKRPPSTPSSTPSTPRASWHSTKSPAKQTDDLRGSSSLRNSQTHELRGSSSLSNSQPSLPGSQIESPDPQSVSTEAKLSPTSAEVCNINRNSQPSLLQLTHNQIQNNHNTYGNNHSQSQTSLNNPPETSHSQVQTSPIVNGDVMSPGSSVSSGHVTPGGKMENPLTRAMRLLQQAADEAANPPLNALSLSRLDDVTLLVGEESNHFPPISERQTSVVVSARGEQTIQVKCRNQKCGKTEELAEARKSYKTCHNCYTYYCSRACRKSHWERHKRKCLFGKVSSISKAVVKKAHDDDHVAADCTRIARAGYLNKGRGCVLLVFSTHVRAEEFVREGACAAEALPVYLGLEEIQEAGGTLGEQMFELLEMARSYNPDVKYVLEVVVLVSTCSGDVQARVPRAEGTCVRVAAKLRLTTNAHAQTRPLVAAAPDPDTLILTAMPGVQFADAAANRKARDVCFINIQRQLRQRGVSLRHHFPEVYGKLCEYVAEHAHFTPITIFPRSQETGRRFMCLIMPDADPDAKWMEKPDLLRELGLSEDI